MVGPPHSFAKRSYPGVRLVLLYDNIEPTFSGMAPIVDFSCFFLYHHFESIEGSAYNNAIFHFCCIIFSE